MKNALDARQLLARVYIHIYTYKCSLRNTCIYIY